MHGGAFTKFCNETLTEQLTPIVRACALPVFQTVLSPVVKEELLKDSREGREAFVAKLQSHRLIGAELKAEPLIKELKDLVLKAHGSSDLAMVLWTCENYDWATGFTPVHPGKTARSSRFFSSSSRTLTPRPADLAAQAEKTSGDESGSMTEPTQIDDKGKKLRQCAAAIDQKFAGDLFDKEDFARYSLLLNMEDWHAHLRSGSARVFAYFLESMFLKDLEGTLKNLRSGLQDGQQVECLRELDNWFPSGEQRTADGE